MTAFGFSYLLGVTCLRNDGFSSCLVKLGFFHCTFYIEKLIYFLGNEIMQIRSIAILNSQVRGQLFSKSCQFNDLKVENKLKSDQMY